MYKKNMNVLIVIVIINMIIVAIQLSDDCFDYILYKIILQIEL